MTEAEGDAARVIAGRYELLHKLGTGGMGRVWLAHDPVLDCDVAIKELDVPPDLPAHEASARVARARGEARHAAKLRNQPNVVTVHDVVEHDGLPWIVMEYVPGAMDLEAFVQEHGALAPAEVAGVGLGVLEALEEGHRLGILHRDVKPANILLAPGGHASTRTPLPSDYTRVSLADYGISLESGSQEPRLTSISGIAGTPGYLAPERVRGGQPTPESDLFSLGATLYFAAVGEGPFDTDTPAAALTAPLLEEAKLPAHLSRELAQVVDGLLAKDPAERITAEEAARLLGEVAGDGHLPPDGKPDGKKGGGGGSTTPDGQQTQTVPPPNPDPGPGTGEPPRQKRRGPLLVALAASAVVLLGVGLWAGSTLLDGDDDPPAPPPSPSGPLMPYGAAVGLTKELKPGDCVAAQWPAAKFAGEPLIKTVDCIKGAPSGQVIATHLPASVEEARKSGGTACDALLRSTASKMAEARAYGVAPSEEGWSRGVRAMPCLLFNTHAPTEGPVGRFRTFGQEISLRTASVGDCFDTREVKGGSLFVLANCETPHKEQVVGFAHASATVKFKDLEAGSEAANMCENDFGAAYTNDRHLVSTWWNKEYWDAGFRHLMCTVVMANGKQLPGGTVQPAAQVRARPAPAARP
ncbi:protein kinase [Streptomyces sp. NPDC090022]|uniref:serine/threonine-protein kinase n=1 Tax=Streptomyces sp. NPDC090022 TaxID=3365920 RepID=UPI003828CF22